MPLVLDIQTITAAIWPSFQDGSGKILDEYSIRKWAFHKGVNDDIRAELWTFLLSYYSFSSTRKDRERIEIEKKLKYEELCNEVACSSEPENAVVLAKYQKVIEKDCLRTDCHLAYYQGENGRENVDKLQRILSCYVVYNPEMGYVQGMNELLSPLLLVLGNEHQAFWCLTNVLHRMKSVFSDLTLSQPLNSLARLCCYADKQIHDHIESVYEGEDWVFCYRNVLLVFKREFTIEEVCSLWETIWCDHMTRYFELFISVAVLIHNKEQILQFTTVESFMEFLMKLSGTIPLRSVISIARSLLERLKNDEYCPYELKHLVSSDGCAPPPLVGFIRTRQRFATLHTNKINTQRLEIQRSMFGELYIEPVSPLSKRLSLASPQLEPVPQKSQLPEGNSMHHNTTISPTTTSKEPVISSPPPKTGFVPRAQTNGISFRDDIRKASLTSPPFSPGLSPLSVQTQPMQSTAHLDSFKLAESTFHDHGGSVITLNGNGTLHQLNGDTTINTESGNGTSPTQNGNWKSSLQNGNLTFDVDSIPYNGYSMTTNRKREGRETETPQSMETYMYQSFSESETVPQSHVQMHNIVENGSNISNCFTVEGNSTVTGNGDLTLSRYTTAGPGTKELQSDFDQLRSDAELTFS